MSALTAPLRIVEAEVLSYHRTWRGTVITSLVNPVFFLAAMGAGLGRLVDEGTGELGLTYLAFVATGLMAASGMQNGASDGSFPVLAGILWRRHFHGAITTPISTRDIIVGRFLWATIKLTLILGVFAVIAVLFGAVEIRPALMAVPPSVLTGLAFMSAITPWTATRENGASLSSLFRFAIVPLFLFSGTFFPITRLPGFLQPVAYATPLFHGVEMVRKIALPGVGAPVVTALPLWVHLVYLLVMTAVGLVLAVRFLDRRLRP
ncbi:MAG TPA: ABC transporter [Acidimicrobiia bacterium]|nr:ABC transporter [Acidimicrobiia bacterium]